MSLSVFKDTTPRVYLARHGETEWTLNGRHTGVTDINLTPAGVQQVLSSSSAFVGESRLIRPSKIAQIYISPRTRAQVTAGLLLGEEVLEGFKREGKVETTEELAEWGYGMYEGWFPRQIREDRKRRGLDTEREWDVWRDGCEDGPEVGENSGLKGESSQEVSDRIDTLIAKIRKLHTGNMNGENGLPMDVVLVSHGHLLRAFAKRWLGYPLHFPVNMILEPGGIGVLSYLHHNIEEPAFVLGGVYRAPTSETMPSGV